MKKLIFLLLLAIFFSPFISQLSQNSSQNALAQTDIYIRGSGKQFPIALPQLCVQEQSTKAGTDIPNIIGRNLDLSGYFEVIDPGSYIETPGDCGRIENFAYSDWSIIGAEGLVRGVVSFEGKLVKTRLFLHDVQRQKVVLGKEYQGDESQIPKMAHKFSNEIMKFFTGEYGVFGTQIAFSSKVGRFKELFVMDMDGSNIKQLTRDKALSLSSSWDRSGTKLVYTSYRFRMPDLFFYDFLKRNTGQLTRGEAMELGGKFSPDGGRLVLSVTSGGDSDIVLMNLDGSILKKLTQPNRAIDVSPDWSPDGRRIVFCSNRGGGPQIYTMNSDGSEVKRISFMTSSYCTSPDWSPKGDRIAFVCRADRGFQIFTVGSDGSDPLQLTSYGDNEDPDWSPDGRYLVFATTFGQGKIPGLALMREDGSNLRQLTSSRIGDSEPSWGPLID